VDLQHLLDDVGEIRARGVEAAAVDERAAVLREFVHKRLLHARAELALRDQGDAAHLAVRDQPARDAARLVLRQQRELIELVAGVHRVAEKIERELRRVLAARTGTTAATSSLVSGPTTNAAPSSTACR
jgi:hypothetical protein